MSRTRVLKGPLGADLVHEASRWQAELAAEFGLVQEDADRLQLCVEELVMNLANHTDPQCANSPVEIHARIDDEVLRLTFVDSCPPFDPLARAAPEPATSIENARIGGLGIMLVRQFADECRYERLDGRNRFELVFELRQPSSR